MGVHRSFLTGSGTATPPPTTPGRMCSHHVDEVPGPDSKISPRKLTALIFREKTPSISGFAAVNFRGEFSCPDRGGHLAIRNPWGFILKTSKPTPAPLRRMPQQLPLEVMPQAALFCPGCNQTNWLEVAQRDGIAAALA